MMNKLEYWPFPVLPPDQRTEHQQEVIAFLGTAFQEGYAPCVLSGSSYEASAPNGRIGDILHRGANRYWEIVLGNSEGKVTSFFIDGFAAAGRSLLQWLRGDDAATVEAQCKANVVSKPGFRGW